MCFMAYGFHEDMKEIELNTWMLEHAVTAMDHLSRLRFVVLRLGVKVPILFSSLDTTTS